MAIEFLYSSEDIPDLIEYLYNNGFYLSKSAGTYKDKPLSLVEAESSLDADLYFPGSKVYWIGNENTGHLLQFVSCGKQSDPCYVGKRGRAAGFLSTKFQADTDCNSVDLQKLVRKYLKKHGVFQQYNGNARMSCFFLTNYRLKAERYVQNPWPNYLCLGTGRTVCHRQKSTEIISKLETLSSCFPAIQNVSLIMTDCWENKNLVDIRYSFLCDHNLFTFFDFQKMILWLSDNKKSVAANQKLQMFGESPPMSLAKSQADQPHMVVFLDNPWQCWVNREHEYSGKPTYLWPDNNNLQ